MKNPHDPTPIEQVACQTGTDLGLAYLRTNERTNERGTSALTSNHDETPPIASVRHHDGQTIRPLVLCGSRPRCLDVRLSIRVSSEHIAGCGPSRRLGHGRRRVSTSSTGCRYGHHLALRDGQL